MNSHCTVVHVTADFPDVLNSVKTPVIKRLVDSLEERSIRNVVVSINRSGKPGAEVIRRDGSLVSVCYFGLPYGVAQRFLLKRLAKRLASYLVQNFGKNLVVIAHKFAVEGVVAQYLSELLGSPFAVGFMGNSDKKMVSAKPHYRNFYRKVISQSEALLFCTPWTKSYFENLFKDRIDRSKKSLVVPYISFDDISPEINFAPDANKLVTIFNLRVWKIKNIRNVLAAIAALAQAGRIVELDIIGSGSQAEVDEIEKLIASFGLANQVRLLGQMGREQIDAILPRYVAMVLPSYPESFGLVYIEALRAGVPIMCARNAGFYGFFSGEFPGVTVDHRSVEEISTGIVSLIENSNQYRHAIKLNSAELKRFERQYVVDAYQEIVTDLQQKLMARG